MEEEEKAKNVSREGKKVTGDMAEICGDMSSWKRREREKKSHISADKSLCFLHGKRRGGGKKAGAWGSAREKSPAAKAAAPNGF